MVVNEGTHSKIRRKLEEVIKLLDSLEGDGCASVRKQVKDHVCDAYIRHGVYIGIAWRK